MSANGKEMI